MAGAPLLDDKQNQVGAVTSSTISPVLSNAAICLGYVKRPLFAEGTVLQVPAEGAMRKATVVKTPFVWRLTTGDGTRRQLHNAPMFESDYLVRPGKKFRLAGHPHRRHRPVQGQGGGRAGDREEPRAHRTSCRRCSTPRRSTRCSIVFQAIDAGGKDGAIRVRLHRRQPAGLHASRASRSRRRWSCRTTSSGGTTWRCRRGG